MAQKNVQPVSSFRRARRGAVGLGYLVCRALYYGQRRAELVGYVGEEVQPEVVEAALGLHLAAQAEPRQPPVTSMLPMCLSVGSPASGLRLSKFTVG